MSHLLSALESYVIASNGGILVVTSDKTDLKTFEKMMLCFYTLTPEEQRWLCPKSGMYKNSPFTVARSVAWCNNEVAGFVDAIDMHTNQAMLSICIGTKYRGRGITHQLIDSIKVTCKEKGYHEIYWRSNKQNTISCRAAEANGFQFVTRTADHILYKLPL